MSRSEAKRFLKPDRDLNPDPYHYKACGLDDVYLLNGFTIEETAYGPGVTIENLHALHEAIGAHLIQSGKPLSAREFRFLRKHMRLTQQELADRLRLDVQTIARYEKEQSAIPGPVDALLKFIFALSLLPQDERVSVLREMMEEIEAESDRRFQKTYFEQKGHRWSVRQGC